MTIKVKLPKKYVVAKLIAIPLLIATIIIWTTIITVPDDYLHVSFFDVGQGDAVLIQTPNGQNILIDGGPSPQSLCLELSNKLPFWEKTLDLVISTQPHADHITGQIEILQRYNIEQVIDANIDYDSAVYNEWLNAIKDNHIKRTIVKAGNIFDLGNDIRIEVLNPPSTQFKGTSNDVDNNGLVLKLLYRQISFLFTADIRHETELNLIMQRIDLKSTVLKVAHHGSDTSTSALFLNFADPEISIISVGTENYYGHPSNEVLNMLANDIGKERIYRTDISGTIELITDGNSLWIEKER